MSYGEVLSVLIRQKIEAAPVGSGFDRVTERSAVDFFVLEEVTETSRTIKISYYGYAVVKIEMLDEETVQKITLHRKTPAFYPTRQMINFILESIEETKPAVFTRMEIYLRREDWYVRRSDGDQGLFFDGMTVYDRG